MKTGFFSSIRSNLTLTLLVGAGAFIIVVSLILQSLITGYLWERYDHEMLNRAQGLVSLVDIDEDGTDMDFAEEVMPQFASTKGPEYFEVYLNGDHLLRRSPSLADSTIPRPHGLYRQPVFETLTLPNIGQVRLVRLSFMPLEDFDDEEDDERPTSTLDVAASGEDQDLNDRESGEFLAEDDRAEDDLDEDDRDEDQPLEHAFVIHGSGEGAATLLLARESEDFTEMLGMITAAIWGSNGLLLLLIVLLVRGSLKKGLRPLDEIRGQVQGIDLEKLDTQIVLARAVTELDPVVTQLNLLLHRLREAMTRERRFTSNVAHELRTPLAELRSLSDVGLKDPGDQEMVEGFFLDVGEITREMEHMVGNLLDLTRCDNGTRVANMEAVDPAAIVAKTWKRTELRAKGRNIFLANGLRRTFTVHSDHQMLEQIIQNLLNNAVSYSPEAGTISVEEAVDGDRLGLVISNPAPNLNQEDLSHLFDRFWQKDTARTGGKNVGLGLALVHAFSSLLGIEIKTHLGGGKVFFTLYFPKS